MRMHLTSTVQKYKYSDFTVKWKSEVDSDSEASSDDAMEGEDNDDEEEEQVCIIHWIDSCT